MWLDDLGVELTKIDRELLAFIRAVDNRKQAIVDDVLSKNAKYPIGYEFNHPQYGFAKVVAFEFNGKRSETLLQFDYGVKSFYKPYFLYKCEVQVEGLGLVTTNVPEHVIDKGVINFNSNLLKVVA